MRFFSLWIIHSILDEWIAPSREWSKKKTPFNILEKSLIFKISCNCYFQGGAWVNEKPFECDIHWWSLINIIGNMKINNEFETPVMCTEYTFLWLSNSMNDVACESRLKHLNTNYSGLSERSFSVYNNIEKLSNDILQIISNIYFDHNWNGKSTVLSAPPCSCQWELCLKRDVLRAFTVVHIPTKCVSTI